MDVQKPMTKRRSNRVAALQFLYMWEINPGENIRDGLYHFFLEQPHEREYYQFAEELILGVLENKEVIDQEIRQLAQNWNFSRIAKVDLSILRLAVFEILMRMDIPPVVSINEAIELSKMFSIPESKRFINGILDQIKNRGNRPAREAMDSETPPVEGDRHSSHDQAQES
jgi:N utilization substance protein B